MLSVGPLFPGSCVPLASVWIDGYTGSRKHESSILECRLVKAARKDLEWLRKRIKKERLIGKGRLSAEREKNLRSLARMMNKQNVTHIPVTRELLECFDVAITPEENEFLLKIGTEPLSYEQISRFSKLSHESFRPFLETICRKGLVWTRNDEKGEEQYVLAPILVGWFEMFLSDGSEAPEKKEFARRVDVLFKSWGKFNIFPIRNLWNLQTEKSRAHRRVVVPGKTDNKKRVLLDVRKPLKASNMKVYPAKSINELIENYGDAGKIALLHCFCRQWRKLLGESCRFDQPYESCIALGDFTGHVVKYGIGRYISKEEALKIIQEVQRKGAVHQVFHEREDLRLSEIAICNCCWDCCGIIGSYSRGLLPIRVKSYYQAQIIDGPSCTGCGTCVKYCPTRAVSVVNKKSKIDGERCIGCGQCELQCTENVIELVYEERDVTLPLLKKSERRIPA
jgi:ferredoxin